MATPHYVFILLISARDRVRDVVQGIAAGADDFFSKPIVPGELLSRMQAGTRVLELEYRLRLLASRDSLTGLLNRRGFDTFFGFLHEGHTFAPPHFPGLISHLRRIEPPRRHLDRAIAHPHRTPRHTLGAEGLLAF